MAIRTWVRRLAAPAATDQRGNIAVMTALALPMLVGFAGIAIEIAYWYLNQRTMQNAADSAAIAAASNATDYYADEAKAVAAQYGYVNGEDSVSVVANNAAATCPSGASACYSVTISKSVPLFLSSIIGFTGGGSGTTELSAIATAERSSTDREYCILATGNSGEEDGIRLNGAPNADLSGCSMMSNTSATCNGHDGDADYGDAHGENDGCGNVQNSNVDVVEDPYTSLAAFIPADTCAGSYPQISRWDDGHEQFAMAVFSGKGKGNDDDDDLPASNQWTGTKELSGDVTICGDLQLTGNVTVNAPDGAVLVIRNGRLDTNGYTLQTASGSALTVVFTGDNGSYTHAPTGSGTLDITAPTSGNWSGVAIYQDPSLTTGVDISEAGNDPTWNITGLVYLPNASVTFSGAVNKSSNGEACFAMVVDNLTINGTGSILTSGSCSEAGLTMPTGTSSGRGMLVH
ncbi:MAG: pilus assembly protein [Alphaproteobacteria bacterium]|nr:pilus assembly protein [Alphaproteobacteria bacterium]MBF0128479.1 pilus assembly protein [Alphaproteobacteria bacterium]